jgi:hypothetical protein
LPEEFDVFFSLNLQFIDVCDPFFRSLASSSPDDAALTGFAQNMGYELFDRSAGRSYFV